MNKIKCIINGEDISDTLYSLSDNGKEMCLAVTKPLDIPTDAKVAITTKYARFNCALTGISGFERYIFKIIEQEEPRYETNDHPRTFLGQLGEFDLYCIDNERIAAYKEDHLCNWEYFVTIVRRSEHTKYVEGYNRAVKMGLIDGSPIIFPTIANGAAIELPRYEPGHCPRTFLGYYNEYDLYYYDRPACIIAVCEDYNAEGVPISTITPTSNPEHIEGYKRAVEQGLIKEPTEDTEQLNSELGGYIEKNKQMEKAIITELNRVFELYEQWGKQEDQYAKGYKEALHYEWKKLADIIRPGRSNYHPECIGVE